MDDVDCGSERTSSLSAKSSLIDALEQLPEALVVCHLVFAAMLMVEAWFSLYRC